MQSRDPHIALKSEVVKKINAGHLEIVLARLITQKRLETAGWPIAELTRKPEQGQGQIFRARVDHADSAY